ncbi:1-deoxy-D-xylulose-5-phosphate synthase [Catenulispora sp. NF23]|uniref:1-deoxy-D-xylulose-5-phosphate synthase n=1 Tax=Catenulispora pinistramenti TaxID=2705254 RepID=UPI001BA79A8E|nr:1-deoxy-D-xylulose-5-phosphate synthase [Catenulispora pinistramenti]MBS2531176.1 1-deoxy-D-xylulose-5-phosphate synthase [Catenulispora pinistramenti]
MAQTDVLGVRTDIPSGPEELRALPPERLPALAATLRAVLVEQVRANGGHLGPNLGVVELTLAVHRVFASPTDRIVFDTGHQSYVHKLLTGRARAFRTLRQEGGLSGYPSRAESVHDIVENSHASTALSYAAGLARACGLRHEDRRVVAVVGDAALSGGLAFEALNDIGGSGCPVVVVLNDNGRSYAPTTGGLARHLARLRAGIADADVFGELGLAYLGPVDGHDVAAVERALSAAAARNGPVIVHCVTVKGKGYLPAETDEADRLHTVGALDPAAAGHAAGHAAGAGSGAGGSAAPAARSWTDVFAEEIVGIGARRPDIVCLTASMLRPVGLRQFADRWPDRVFDVGIAEQHAVCSAAGLALGGLHPVVAVYASFLNRAFDQVIMDVALHRLAVTFVLDRAGITGPDGASHHGMWDLSFLAMVPGLRVAAPRDSTRLRALLAEAVAVSTGPTAVRFPKSGVGADVPAIGRLDGVDVLYDTGRDVLLVAAGPVAPACVEAAALLAASGIGARVVDPRWILPADRTVVRLAAEHRLVLTVEDSGRGGGMGAALAQAVADAGIGTRVHSLGLPRRFLPHGERAALLAAHGFTGAALAEAARRALAGAVPQPEMRAS